MWNEKIGKKKVVPGYGTRERLPFVFEVRIIRAAVLLAVELWIYKGTGRGRVERVWSIVDPFATEQIASTTKFSTTQIGSSIVKGIEIFSFCLVGKQKQEQQKQWLEETHFLGFRSRIIQEKDEEWSKSCLKQVLFIIYSGERVWAFSL